MEWLRGQARHEHHRRRAPHVGCRHGRRQDGGRVAAHRQDRVGDRRALHRGFSRRHGGAQYRAAVHPVPCDRPHPRADRFHCRYREERVTRIGRRMASISTPAGSRTTATSRGWTGPASKRASASTWERRKAQPILRCGNSLRRARSARWNGRVPWGVGFPGWHIECSAMAQKYLGDYFDIHCGGEDHIPVHHTNEIAQTEARVGTRLANFWMHGYFLLSNDAKMAKSAGEFLRLKVAHRSRLRSACVSLPVPDRALSDADEFHVGRARCGDDRARSAAQWRPRAGRARRTRRRLPRALRRRAQCRPQHAASHGDRVGSAARRIACGGEESNAARVRSRIWPGARHMAAQGRGDSAAQCRNSRQRAPPRARRSNGQRRIGCAWRCTRRAGKWKTAPTATRSSGGSSGPS